MVLFARPAIGRLSAAASLVALVAPAAAMAQGARITVAPMPLAQALQRIQAESGVGIDYDPDAVAGLTSAPVTDARSANEAVRRAVRNMHLTVQRGANGRIVVTSDIVVVAHRDEAETSVLVNQTSTSDRNGQSLRGQARNTQVVSAKQIADQQALTISEALRNVAGVSLNGANVQSGATYSVRGFNSNGLINGLPGSTSTGVPAGATQSGANVERIEVLKGPDALLAGAGNLGGAINIATKKPSADTLLAPTMETGSFGLARITIDANEAVSDDKRLSARMIAVASTTDRNFGGFKGDEEYLLAPTLRFKDQHTDIVIGGSTSDQTFGTTPFTLVNPATKTLYDRPLDKPIFGRDQYVRTGDTRAFVDATQTVGDFLALVVRAQHQHTTLDIHNYTLLAVLDPASDLALATNGGVRQVGNSNAVDAYARAKFTTFGIRHTLNAGYTYVDGSTANYASSREDAYPVTFDGTPPGIAAPDTLSYTQGSTQNGFYAQDLLEFWKLHISAGVRHTDFNATTTTYFRGTRTTVENAGATTPSFGAVLDVTPGISVYGNYFRGFFPSFTRGFNGALLPNIQTRNVEGGVKIDLFAKRVLVNASYFDLRQSNLIIADPQHAGFSIGAPGQQGKGVDLSIAGLVLPGWTVQGGLTRTTYSFLTPTGFGDVVQAQPRDQYNIYTSYRHKIGNDMNAGLGLGVFGRSSASVDRYGLFYTPAALSVDGNAFLKIKAVDLNLGIRNLFDRRNYGTSYTPTYVPLGEPRTFRLSMNVRFF